MMVDKENIGDIDNIMYHDRNDQSATKSIAKNVIKSVPSSSNGASLCPSLSCAQLRAQLAMMERQYSDTIIRMERLEGKYRLCWQAANDCKDHVSRVDYNILRKQNALLRATHVGKTVLSAAPAWQNRDACTRCQLTRSHDAAKFGITRRRHHCRSCGHSLCSSCIGNQEMPLPHLGFFKPVRVCHTCTSALAIAHAAATATTTATATAAATSSSGSSAAAAAARRRSSIGGRAGIAVLPPAMAPSQPSSICPPAMVASTVISSPSAPACVLPTPLPTPNTAAVHSSSVDSWTVRPPSVPSSPSASSCVTSCNNNHDHVGIPLPVIPSSDDESKIPVAPSLDDVVTVAYVPPTPPPLDDTYLAASSATVIYHGTTSAAAIDTNVPLSSSLTSSSIEAARAGLRRRASTSSVPITSTADKIADAAQVRDQILAAIRSRASSASSTATTSSSASSIDSAASSSSSSSSSECPRTPLRSGKARSSSFSRASPKDMLSMLQAQVRARRIGITRGSDDTTAVSTNSMLPRCVTPVQRRCPPTPTSHNVALRTPMISDTVAQMLDCSPGVPLKPQADEWTD